MAKSKEIKDKESGLIIIEKQTDPPRRFSEASLIKKLGELNIGRPSTTTTILSTLLDPGRGYCEEQGKALVPTEKGINLIHFLKEAFPEIINYDYTANMEASLDKIAKGDLDRVDYLKEFYTDLENQIKNAKGIEADKPQVEDIGRICPQCGKPLIKRHGKYGDFIACTGWKPYNKGCNYTEKI